jgi:phenylacetate-CoA ligase
MRRRSALWRHLRYVLEFGLIYCIAKWVIPLREFAYPKNRPQFVSDIQGTSKGDISQQNIKSISKLLSRKISSGGTTGTPVTFYEYVWVTILERMYNLYLWSMVGWKPLHRSVVFRGDRIPGLTERRGRMLVISSYMMAQRVDKVVAEIAAFRPKWVWAYPSVFFTFKKIADAQLRLNGIKGFLFMSEKLYGWQKEELIKEYPTARIFEGYGSSEKAALAYRIYPDRYFSTVSSYSQILLKPIEYAGNWPRSCSLFGTSFIQSPTRIQNYNTGDIVIAQADGTICEILGREQDFILLKDGTVIAFSQVIGSIHTKVWEDVRRFRFEQERMGQLEVYLEEVRSDRRSYIREQFEALIADALGGGVKLRFHFGKMRPLRSSTGKAIYFVQHMEMQARD